MARHTPTLRFSMENPDVKIPSPNPASSQCWNPRRNTCAKRWRGMTIATRPPTRHQPSTAPWQDRPWAIAVGLPISSRLAGKSA